MKIIVAQSAGFCFGVKRAIGNAEQEAQGYNSILYTVGELIHNPQEIERLRQKGIEPAYDIEALANNRVIIRTHGVPQDIIKRIEELNASVLDLTCPYVKKIHNIVSKYSKDGYEIIIIGDREHPEVKGICGWCDNKALVATAPEDLPSSLSDKLCVVAQTTISRKMWDDVIAAVLEKNNEAVIHDTVCEATNQRQTEAKTLAGEVEAMIVIGGKNSSNTKKLYEVCSKVCPKTYHIETAEDLPAGIEKANTIGITAGASTPAHIIKEVITTMENNAINNNQEELSFAEAFEQSLKTLNTGETVKGTVIDVSQTEVVVNLGFKSDGIIKASELTDDPTLSPADLVKVGDEIEAFVVRVNDVEGQVMLSMKKLVFEKNWLAMEKSFEDGSVLTGKVVEVLPNGLSLYSGGVRVFVPASQSSDRYISDLSTLSGKELSFKVIDINRRRRRVVGSVKAIAKEVAQKNKDEFWTTAEVGKQYSGTVKSLTQFGAFVDIGVDGLIHISDLSWKKINHPKEVLKEGDVVDVSIKSMDKETNKVSLNYLSKGENPWDKFKTAHNVGDIVNGTVLRLVPFGAFVNIDGVDCLLHISELSWRRINHPGEVLKEGQVIEAYIKEIEDATQKVSLGYKKVEENPWEILKSQYKEGDVVKVKVVRLVTFGAFAEIIDGVDGLIHISQIADKKIDKASDVLSVGQEVDAKITEINLETGKVSLSIRALIEEKAAAEDALNVMPEQPDAQPDQTSFAAALDQATATEEAAEDLEAKEAE